MPEIFFIDDSSGRLIRLPTPHKVPTTTKEMTIIAMILLSTLYINRQSTSKSLLIDVELSLSDYSGILLNQCCALFSYECLLQSI